MEPLRFTLDGGAVEVAVPDPKAPALGVLREALGVAGAKPGCSPQGSCGACTVLVDQKPRLTCTLPVKSLAGKAVDTLATVPEPVRRALADAMVAEHAAQCGYCTPGLVVSGAALLAAGRAPTDEELDRALAPHVCRCTGYASIRRAFARAAEGGVPEADPEAAAVVLGARPFVDELVREGALAGAVVLAGPGTLSAVALDAARAAPGVRAVVALVAEGAALPHPVPVVAVAAESRAQARAAAALVSATVTPAPAAAPRPLLRAVRRAGDVAAAFAAADSVRRLTLTFAPTDAVPLEAEAALAVPSPSGVTVYASVHDARALADALTAELGAPVRVRVLPSGGSYGARRVPTIEGAAARLARATDAPVKLTLDHEEGTRLRVRRPGATAVGELALDAGGRPIGLRLHVAFDGGAVAHEPERLLADALDALVDAPDAVELVAEVLVSDGAPTGPLRAAGTLAPTVAWAALRDGAADGPLRDALDAPGDAAVALARAAGGAGAEVVLRVVDAGTVEVHASVPELGQGRDRALLGALTATTGLPREAFDVAWGDSAELSAGGEGPVGPAAAAAGRALAAAGGPLAARVGERFVGRSGPAPEGRAAAWAEAGPDGSVAALTVAVEVGDQDLAVARSLAEGGAAMGLGLALAEEVPRAAAGGDEVRFRYLGTLKSKQTPPIRAVLVPVPGGPREVDEAACAAACAAVVALVRRAEPRDAVPMKDTAAARAVGVRPPRPARGEPGAG